MNGKESRKYAIEQTTGVRLDSSLSVREIKYFITTHIYNTPAWGEYLKSYKVANKKFLSR